MKKSIFYSLLIVLLLVVAFIYTPLSELRQRSAVCRVTVESYFALPLADGDTLYLSTTPQTAHQAGITADSVVSRISQSAVWISPSGHLLTTAKANGYAPHILDGQMLYNRLQGLDTLMARRLEQLCSEVYELDYYADRHSVVDDGYNEVMGYRTYIQGLLHYIDSTHSRLQQALKQSAGCAKLCQHIEIQPVGQQSTEEGFEVHRADSLLLLQTVQTALPTGASYLPLAVDFRPAAAHHLVAYNDWGNLNLSDSAWVLYEEAPQLPASAGGAWVNRSGQLCGLSLEGQVQSLTAFLHPAGWSTPLSWLWAWNAVPRWAAERPTTWRGPAVPCVNLTLADSSAYIGQTRKDEVTGMTQRHGHGAWQQLDGTVLQGKWAADTLVYGQRIDSVGTYEGTFNARLQAEGLGSYQAKAYEFYFGEWKNGLRQGWGFSSRPGELIHSGVWRKGKFRGERVVYTADRVYGIDISRYQHEVKGRVHGIDWKNLRITYLAKDRPVQGEVDYPVSYVYIKSTQGDDILNRYYKNDSRQARKHGIPVGSYHFFSTKMSGAKQAAHFLKHSKVLENDLPPMLDVEPSDRRVARMGGDEELIRQMKIWLQIVERATGKRPVIYSYQRFIDEHLAQSPELLHEYPVWVARYGVYKPYYRLLHWQLSPTGHVQGIQGEVDINVFNGTKEQFRDYLHSMTQTEP